MASSIIKPSPSTIWNILDRFLIDLAASQDKICSEAPSLSKPLYQGLVDLVCKDDTRVLDDIDFGKPYYPFILITYYILFHRHNLETAVAVYKKLEEAYKKHPYTFDPDEECSLKALGKVIEDFTILKKRPLEEYKGRLGTRLRETVLKIKDIRCYQEGWSNAFKELVISRLDPEEGIRILRETIDKLDKSERIIIDEEVLEGYNLVVYGNPPPVVRFLKYISDSVYRALEDAFKELRNKEIELKDLERRINDLQKYIPWLKGVGEIVKDIKDIILTLLHASPFIAGAITYQLTGTWPYTLAVSLPSALPLLFLYGSLYTKRKKSNKIKKEVESFIEERILREIYETIWPIS
jgi:glycosyltransferase involved in cell wall biosynthesis